MKKAEKFEVGKAIASNSDGRIALAIEDGVAVLRGTFTRAERKPLRFKKGAGWRYKMVDGVETWSLRVEQKKSEPKPKAEPEPNTNGIYVRWNGERPESFRIARATEKSIWLVGADGKEFRKAIGESAERLSGDFYRVG